MSQMNKSWIFLGAVAFFTACQSNTSHDPLVEEAYQIHMEAVNLQKQLKPKLDSLVALDSARYSNLQKDFLDWQETLVEVPGFDHDHDHDHDHHNHAAQPEVTPEQMKAIQMESLTNLKKLGAQIR
jgi:hypothetical protein